MRRSARPLSAVLTLSLVYAAAGTAACRPADRHATGRTAADSALDRDLTLTAQARTQPRAEDSIGFGDTAVATPAAPPRLHAAKSTGEVTPAPSRPRARRAGRPARTPSGTGTAADVPATGAVDSGVPATADASGAPRDVATGSAEPSNAAPGTAVGSASGTASGRAVAAGTVLAASTGQRVCTETTRPGDRITAALTGPVTGPSGTLLPAGTPVVLEVAHVATDPATVEFVARGVSVGGSYLPIVADVAPVTGTLERRAIEKPAGAGRSSAINGALVGAILGRVLGRSTKATIIGAAGGAAAGAAMGRSGTRYEACLVPGAPVRVRLVDQLVLR